MTAAAQQSVVRSTLTVTVICIVASVAITAAVTWITTGTLSMGVGLLLAVLVPAVIAPIGSYPHLSMAARLRDANERLKALSETDSLTRIFNRRHFLESAGQQLALARRHGYPTGLLLIDFDHFKQINDRYGHSTGDRVLVEAVGVIAGALRESDTLARFGGEEFIVLLPHTAREGVQLVAERVRTAVAAHPFFPGEPGRAVTVSIGGVSPESSNLSLEVLTSRADRLLYASKQAGRNRSTVESVSADAETLTSSAG